MSDALRRAPAGVKDVLRNLPVPQGQLAGIAVGYLLRRRWRAPLPGGAPVRRLTGLSLVAAGAAVNAWALTERRRHFAGPFDLERPDSLVTSGPYALSRHPMYVGWWLIHLGAGVFGGAVWFIATVPAAVLGEHPWVVAEERELAAVFGEEYTAYAERVPRYLPVLAGR